MKVLDRNTQYEYYKKIKKLVYAKTGRVGRVYESRWTELFWRFNTQYNDHYVPYTKTRDEEECISMILDNGMIYELYEIAVEIDKHFRNYNSLSKQEQLEKKERNKRIEKRIGKTIGDIQEEVQHNLSRVYEL